MPTEHDRPGPAPGRSCVLAALLLALAAAAAAAPPGPEPGPARGRDVTGRWGIGVVTGEAPLGVRHLWERRYGFDAGVGFDFLGAGSVDSRIALEGAFLYALAPGERVNCYLRPGVRFRSESAPEGSTTRVGLGAGLEFEVFLSGDFSLGARTGVFIDSVSPPGAAGNRTDWGLSADLVTRAGFLFYLPAGD